MIFKKDEWKLNHLSCSETLKNKLDLWNFAELIFL